MTLYLNNLYHGLAGYEPIIFAKALTDSHNKPLLVLVVVVV